MDILQLEHFMAVVEEGSFSRAAEKVFRTQPAISQSVKKLEEEVGMPLFARDIHDVALTEAGKVLVEYARRILGRSGSVGEANRLRRPDRGRGQGQLQGQGPDARDRHAHDQGRHQREGTRPGADHDDEGPARDPVGQDDHGEVAQVAERREVSPDRPEGRHQTGEQDQAEVLSTTVPQKPKAGRRKAARFFLRPG